MQSCTKPAQLHQLIFQFGRTLLLQISGDNSGDKQQPISCTRRQQQAAQFRFAFFLTDDPLDNMVTPN